MRAAVDAEIEVKSTDHGFQIKITKLKDGASDKTYNFNLIPVSLDLDEDGEWITSCVVKHEDDLNTTPVKLKRKGKWEKNIIKAMRQIAGGESKALKESVIDCAINLSKEPKPEEGKRDQRKGSASRALNTLVEQGYYTMSDEHIFIPNDKKPDVAIEQDKN